MLFTPVAMLIGVIMSKVLINLSFVAKAASLLITKSYYFFPAKSMICLVLVYLSSCVVAVSL